MAPLSCSGGVDSVSFGLDSRPGGCLEGAGQIGGAIALPDQLQCEGHQHPAQRGRGVNRNPNPFPAGHDRFAPLRAVGFQVIRCEVPTLTGQRQHPRGNLALGHKARTFMAENLQHIGEIRVAVQSARSQRLAILAAHQGA